MKIVIDTSVIMAVIANEPEKEVLIRLTRGAQLIAPRSVHWEIGNAFSALFKRKRVTLAQAHRSLEVYRHIQLDFIEVELASALDIAQQLNMTPILSNAH